MENVRENLGPVGLHCAYVLLAKLTALGITETLEVCLAALRARLCASTTLDGSTILCGC